MITHILVFLFMMVINTMSASFVEFVVIVTSFNNEDYVNRNLDSIFSQKTSRPFQTIYVDDCSVDSTHEKVRAYAQRHNLDESKLRIIRNTKRIGSGLANIFHAVHAWIDDSKVVVCIDGDDYLSFSGALRRVEQEYADQEVWMTYGRFVVIPSGELWSQCSGYPEDVIKERSFRKHHNVPSHLKTFRAALFKHIKREDLVDENGHFYTKAWDMAMMFPMLEMCAPHPNKTINHSRFIKDILYIYNFANPLGDAQTHQGRELQIRFDKLIRNKIPYEPLERLMYKK